MPNPVEFHFDSLIDSSFPLLQKIPAPGFWISITMHPADDDPPGSGLHIGQWTHRLTNRMALAGTSGPLIWPSKGRQGPNMKGR